MSGSVFFPEDVWTGMEIMVLHPSPSRWRLVMKISESSLQMDEKEARDDNSTPSSFALFECENVNDASQKAHMHIDMQIPLAGTEFTRSATRANQASLEVPRRIKDALKAYQLLTDAGCQYTPTLIGHTVANQPPDGLVPGGYAQYIVTTKVSGDRLGTGVWNPYSDKLPEGLFWELEPEERSLIRSSFEFAWRQMNEAGVMLTFGFLQNLFWDRTMQILYIEGYFEPREQVYGTTVETWGPIILYSWGLAIMPKSDRRNMRNLYNYSDFNEDTLEDAGWIL
ncbi:hypothetical protein BDV59DRAFT_170947 [Aspergillus ambiguus]|uniref:uncharacterized protein n=1 Tax=Aspergillus ambiguus TaxID=176160 RepID=UPI003CCD3F6B